MAAPLLDSFPPRFQRNPNSPMDKLQEEGSLMVVVGQRCSHGVVRMAGGL